METITRLLICTFIFYSLQAYAQWGSDASVLKDVSIRESGTTYSVTTSEKNSTEKPFEIEAVYEATECSSTLLSIDVHNAYLPLTWYELDDLGLITRVLFFPELESFKKNTTYVVKDFSQHTDTIFIELDESLAIDRIYPNPHQGMLNIEYSAMDASSMTITILDVSGRLVYEYEQFLTDGPHTASLNLQSLAEGVYFLQLRGRCIHEFRKIIHLN